MRIALEFFDLDPGLVGTGNRSCEDFLGKVGRGEEIPGTPQQVFYECDPDDDGFCTEAWFEGGPALDVEPGRYVVFVQVFATKTEGLPPYLEGCNDGFDTGGGGAGNERVPVDLQFVLPSNARIELAGTNRIAAAPGTPATHRLRVRVVADAPRSNTTAFGIPGVPIRFLPTGGATVGTALAGASFVSESLLDGVAEATVTVPSAPGVAEVFAEADIPGVRERVRFVVSAIASVPFESVAARIEGLGAPRGLAFGALGPAEGPSLVVVGCAGGEAACPESGDPDAPPGSTQVRVFTDLDRAPRELPILPGAELGILPADVFIAPVGPNGSLRAGVVNRRRVECQDRVCTDPETCPCWTLQSGTACPCEGAEIRYLARDGESIRLEARLTLTASNAVAATPYLPRSDDSTVRVAIAGQGRARNERPCSEDDLCMEYRDCRTQPESCGCPPEEQCDCPNCGPTQTPRCSARDRMVDMAGVDTMGALVNHLGCQERIVDCNKSDRSGVCVCADGPRTGAVCGDDAGRDACGCTVPQRVRVGSKNATTVPLDLAVGRFDTDPLVDLVVGSRAGLELFAGLANAFEYKFRPSVNSPIDLVDAANLDPESELQQGGPSLDDIAWAARGSCTRGISQEAQCPIIEEIENAQGCFGALLSDGVNSLILESEERGKERCRRWDLEAPPIGLCLGDFDGSGTEDLALTVEGANHVKLLWGDGWGGWVYPPVEVALPPGASSGRLACGDSDGDGRVDMAVADADGNLTLLRSRP